MLAGRDLSEAFEELEARLAERPGFYRGTSAMANFGELAPSFDELSRLRSLLEGAGIELRALAGATALEEIASSEGLAFEAAVPRESARKFRARPQVELSEAARSLTADFAGARGDIAQRRRRGEASVRRPVVHPREPAAAPPALHLVAPVPSTYYQSGTLRGGQALHHTGNIVVVGDVNPGAELVATGDIVVFGRLGGIAHAGARGDEAARICAIDLAATQLRIATFIAADNDAKRPRTPAPEAAVVQNGRIVIVPLAKLSQLIPPKPKEPET